MAAPSPLHFTELGLPTVERARQPKVLARRKIRIAIRVAAAVLAVSIALWLGLRLAMTPGQSPVEYRSAAVDTGLIRAKVSANGALSALVTVSVGSQVSGRIETLRADFGSHVTKGQVIATIEPAVFRAAAAQASANHAAATAAVERAEARRLNAERQFERARDLYAEGIVTEADYEEAEANLEVARADLTVSRANVKQARAARDQADLNLRFTTIVSPIDGVVISRNVDVGQTVAAALQAPTLFTIAQDLTRMQVDTNVAEADVGKIREGMPVTFTVDAHSGRTFTGRVRQVRDNAQTLQNVVTYDAVVDVENPDRLLKPGMTANVTFTYAERARVLRVPNAALRFKPDATVLASMTDAGLPVATRSDQRTLWVLRGGRAFPVSVHVGITDGSWTEVTRGDVRSGDQAILEAVVNSARRSP